MKSCHYLRPTPRQACTRYCASMQAFFFDCFPPERLRWCDPRLLHCLASHLLTACFYLVLCLIAGMDICSTCVSHQIVTLRTLIKIPPSIKFPSSIFRQTWWDQIHTQISLCLTHWWGWCAGHWALLQNSTSVLATKRYKQITRLTHLTFSCCCSASTTCSCGSKRNRWIVKVCRFVNWNGSKIHHLPCQVIRVGTVCWSMMAVCYMLQVKQRSGRSARSTRLPEKHQACHRTSVCTPWVPGSKVWVRRAQTDTLVLSNFTDNQSRDPV